MLTVIKLYDMMGWMNTNTRAGNDLATKDRSRG